MKKILLWLREYGIILLVVVLLINSMQTCNARRQADQNYKQIELNTKRIDSIIAHKNIFILQQKELALLLKINGYQISKRILYDNNAIIRQVTRPDDQMNLYDVEIEKLEKELNNTQNIKK